MKQQLPSSEKESRVRKHEAKQVREESSGLILSTSCERERLRELLHDGLGQMLTSATFVAHSLRQRLAARGIEEAEMVDEVLLLLNEAIAESRTLAARCEMPPQDALGNSSRPSAAL